LGLRAGLDVAGLDRGAEQLGAHGFQAVEEVGVQSGEAAAVGLQASASPCLVTRKSTQSSIH
jgi:hypothetical protein